MNLPKRNLASLSTERASLQHFTNTWLGRASGYKNKLLSIFKQTTQTHTLVAVRELTKIGGDDKIRHLYLTLFVFKQKKARKSRKNNKIS